MNPSTKAVPMTKDETMLLVQLVTRSAIIINKATTAKNNKMKDQAWRTLAVDFNSSVSSSRRTPAQLRLKWENLKKAARKRCANMRMSRNKTGGGNDYFRPDEVLDKVASLLGSTRTDFYLNKASGSGVLAKRKHMMEEENCKARTMRENALTEYLLVKKKKVELENRKLELENEEKELHIAKLKIELEIARSEEDSN